MLALRASVRTIANKHHLRALTTRTLLNEERIEGRPWQEIPGPSSLPVIGQLHHYLPGGSLRNDDLTIFDLLSEKFGPIVKIDGAFGSPPLIVLFDAEGISQVLRSENSLPIRLGFESLTYYRKVYKKPNPDATTGLVSDQGEMWKKFRSTVNPILLQPKTIKLYQKNLRELSEDMITRMKYIRNDKNMLDGEFDVEMNLWALESIGVVALGGRIGCLERNLPEDSPARKMIQTVHDIFKTANSLEFKLSPWRYISTPLFKKAMQLYDDQVELSKFFIERAKKQFLNKDKISDEEKGILEKLLEIDENVAVIMATDLLLAGVDTTANTLTATLYLLAKNPDKQNKLREEILSKAERQPYLRACIKESIRMMPVVPGNLRKTTKEYNILGYKIPKDMNVAFPHQRLALMEEHYPRPKEYIPERWIADKNDPLYHGNAHPFAMLPFGFGVRSCIGRRIAELEIETFLSKLLENFHVEWFGPPMKVKPAALNYTIEPFNFIFKDIK